jgi:hypothetical protein
VPKGNKRMKKTKFAVSAIASVATLAGAFAFTSHNPRSFGAGTLFTNTGGITSCRAVDCTRNITNPATCPTQVYFTGKNEINNECTGSLGPITPHLIALIGVYVKRNLNRQ